MTRLFAGLAWSLLSATVAGCGGPQELGKAGTKCFRDDDCVAGLICVAPVGKTSRVCSNDPTPIVSMVEGPPVAEGGNAAATAGTGGGAVAAGGASAGSASGGAGGRGGDAATAGTSSAGTDPGTSGSGGSEPAAGGAPP